ncbi:MAG TPA: tRNA-dihydrouridine synthase family protein [Candidatus Magasanikbacteria bacterium]|nr:tRNA-dihydrouridine synthase family protein [Candidatus Magasanikbacteria bacterium]
MWIKDILDKTKKILALSPMADMTDSAFCQIVRSIGGADVVFREMVSAEALIRDNEKTLGMTDFVEGERPIVQQIFGSDPLTMAKAASIVMEHAGPEGIDINMGCPVYKITSNFNGCALMKDPKLAQNIIREIKRAIGDTPLSVKIRLGWTNRDDFKYFIPAIEEAGAQLITVHGRTKEQGYSGVSDWNLIAEAKKIATVPLLANGDIHKPKQVGEALEVTGADGVLIARGALGNPWFFKEYLNPDFSVSLEERVKVVLEHARLHMMHQSRIRAMGKKNKAEGVSAEEIQQRSMPTFRKHLAWYFKNERIGERMEGAKELRMKLMKVETIEELEHILGELIAR